MHILLKGIVVADFSEEISYIKKNTRNKHLVGCKEYEADFISCNETLYPLKTGYTYEQFDLISVETIPENLETDGSWVYEDGVFSQSEELKAQLVRNQRDELISATDYLMVVDAPIEGEVQGQVKEYRKQLRDIPQQENFPFAVVFPQNPLEVVKSEEETVGEVEENSKEIAEDS